MSDKPTKATRAKLAKPACLDMISAPKPIMLVIKAAETLSAVVTIGSISSGASRSCKSIW